MPPSVRRLLLCFVASVSGVPLARAEQEPAPLVATETAGSTRPKVVVSLLAGGAMRGILLGELQFLGFDAIAREVDRPYDLATLRAEARRAGAAALIHVDGEAESLTITVVDRMTGKVVSRTLRAQDSGSPRAAAVKAVELLRASLLELEEGPPPVEREVDVDPPLPRRRERTRFMLHLGPAVAVAPGGLSPTMLLRGGFRFMPRPRVGLVVRGTAPLLAARVSAREGDADVRIGWGTVGAHVALRPRVEAVVQPYLELGLGVAGFAMLGTADPPFVGGRDRVVTGVGELVAGVEFLVRRHFALHVGAASGACFTRPDVRFARRTVGTWCLPYGAAEAGVAVRW